MITKFVQIVWILGRSFLLSKYFVFEMIYIEFHCSCVKVMVFGLHPLANYLKVLRNNAGLYKCTLAMCYLRK